MSKPFSCLAIEGPNPSITIVTLGLVQRTNVKGHGLEREGLHAFYRVSHAPFRFAFSE